MNIFDCDDKIFEVYSTNQEIQSLLNIDVKLIWRPYTQERMLYKILC